MTTSTSMPPLLPYRDTNVLGNCMVKQLLGRQVMLHDPIPSNTTQGRATGIFFTGVTATGVAHVIGSLESSGSNDASKGGQLKIKCNNGTLNDLVVTIDGTTQDVDLVSSINIGGSGQTDAEYRVRGSAVLSETMLNLRGQSPHITFGNTWKLALVDGNLQFLYQELDTEGRVVTPWRSVCIMRPE